MNPSLEEPLVFGVQILKDKFGVPNKIILVRYFTIMEQNNLFLSQLLSDCLQNDYIVLKNPVHIKINDKLKAMMELKKCGIKIIKKEEAYKASF